MSEIDKDNLGKKTSTAGGLLAEKEMRSPISTAESPINASQNSGNPHPSSEELHDRYPPDSHILVSTEEIAPTATINNMQTLMHIFKGNIGTGILSLPIAVKNSGLWTGLAGILCIGAIAVHCMHMLIRCNHILCKRVGSTSLDYAGVMEMCLKTGPHWGRRFSRYVRPFVDALLVFTQLGACCVYIAFIATNVQMVVNASVSDSTNVRVYELCVMLILIPFVCIRNLRLLAPFSAFANILTITGMVIIIQYIVQDLPDTSKRPAFSSFDDIPMFFGTAIFCVEGIGLVLPLRNSMRRPQDFAGWFGVLNLGMVATVCLYATIGFYGYLKFGDAVKSTVTLSLPDDKLYLSVRVMFAVSILITYNIQFYVPITITWPRIARRFRNQLILKYGEYVYRIVVLTMTFGIAAAVPHVDLLISLIGAVACSFLALILPAIIEIMTLHEEERKLPVHIAVKDVLIFLFGIFGSVIGTYTSIKAISETF